MKPKKKERKNAKEQSLFIVCSRLKIFLGKVKGGTLESKQCPNLSLVLFLYHISCYFPHGTNKYTIRCLHFYQFITTPFSSVDKELKFPANRMIFLLIIFLSPQLRQNLTFSRKSIKQLFSEPLPKLFPYKTADRVWVRPGL